MLTTIIPFVDMYALVIWRLYILAMQCLQIQGYFICKYFGDIMQYGGMCFICILYLTMSLSNQRTKFVPHDHGIFQRIL